MIPNVSVHEEATEELGNAAKWYDEHLSGLGKDFTDEVEKVMEFVCSFPEAAPKTRGGARKRILHRFPYNIIYRIMPDKIRILAIAHQKRRPFYWRGRK